MIPLSFRIAVVFTLLACALGQAQARVLAPATNIRVLVYGVHYGGNLVYNYKVVNNGDTAFNNFTIGCGFDSVKNYLYPQLVRLPLGWKEGETGEIGTAIVLAPSSTNQPTGWTSLVYGKQGTSTYYLRWLASRGHEVPNIIRPGETLTGFSVTVPLEDSQLDLPMVTGQPVFTGPDEMYVKGGFRVGLVSGKEVWGTLERVDTTPPTLTVTLNPSTMPANGSMVPITATITIKDDYDPAPAIQLEAIMSNEVVDKDDVRGAEPGTDDRQFQLKAEHTEGNHAGRIYTIVYSATDGSGNKATASATVTVTREERGHNEHGDKDRRDDRDIKDKHDRDEHKRDR